MVDAGNEVNPPLGRVLMVQGTASHVGKSVLVSALCRILRQDGLRVAPFKAQNMSNNSYVTPDGAEIGRAQAVQAEAAGVEARVEMNPVLLKPEADSHAQVVLMGRPWTSARARDYFDMKATLWESVAQSLDTLRREHDVVVIEGAGSPAEINLKATEIVNMRVALHADAPVLLCGDIDRGGVFASLVGTLQLLDEAERAAVKGLLINKFRGDVSLLTDGLTWLEDYTSKPVVGVVHHFRDIHIPEEDSVALEITPPSSTAAAVLDVAVVQVPHISNFDDFDPLAREPGVNLRYVQHGDRLGESRPGNTAGQQDDDSGPAVDGTAGVIASGVIGPRARLGHRRHLRRLPDARRNAVRPGRHRVNHRAGGRAGPPTVVHHLCRQQGDPPGAGDGAVGGQRERRAAIGRGRRERRWATRYTWGARWARGSFPAFAVNDRADAPVMAATALDGALDASGRVMGTYIHGLFHNAGVRRAMLGELARRKGVTLPDGVDVARDREYDRLADWVRGSLRMDLVYEMTGVSPSP